MMTICTRLITNIPNYAKMLQRLCECWYFEVSSSIHPLTPAPLSRRGRGDTTDRHHCGNIQQTRAVGTCPLSASGECKHPCAYQPVAEERADVRQWRTRVRGSITPSSPLGRTNERRIYPRGDRTCRMARFAGHQEAPCLRRRKVYRRSFAVRRTCR